LTKIEALPLPFLIAAYFAREAIVGRVRRQWLWFLVPYFALLGQAIAHAWLISSWYTATSFQKTLSPRALLLAAVAVALFLGASLVVLAVPLTRQAVRRSLTARGWTRVANVILPAAIATVAIYAYYVRPLSVVGLTGVTLDAARLQTVNDAESFVRLGWYVTPLGLLLGIIGWMLLVRDERNRRSGLLLLV
jgi:hypothetical protein